MQTKTILSLIVLGSEALRLDDTTAGVNVDATDPGTVSIGGDQVGVDIGLDGTVDVNIGSSNSSDSEEPTYTNMGDSCWLDFTEKPESNIVCPNDYVNENGACLSPKPSGTRCLGLACTRVCPGGWWDHLTMCERPIKKYEYARPYYYTWSGWSRKKKYHSCMSGYSKSGSKCKPKDFSCMSKTTGDGNYCNKTVYTRDVHLSSSMECSNGGEWNALTLQCDDRCPEAFPNEFALLPYACLSDCPVNTTRCEIPNSNTGTFCLDDSKNCTDYALDITGYALDWTVAITTMNPLAIFNQIRGDHPELVFGTCQV